jgi:hypothetical protein
MKNISNQLREEFKKNPFQDKFAKYIWIDFDRCSCYIGMSFEPGYEEFKKLSAEIKDSIVLSCFASHENNLKTRIKNNKLQVREKYWSLRNL